jgi:hypothetical protein
MKNVKWKFKSCPRCSGDIFIDVGIFDKVETCLQCGYKKEVEVFNVYKERGIGKIDRTLEISNRGRKEKTKLSQMT